MMSAANRRYHLALRILHWVIAALVIFQLIIGGLVLSDMPAAEKFLPLRGHIMFGLTIGVLVLVRLLTRFTTTRPPKAKTGNVALDRLGSTAHALFYVVLLAMVSTGIGIAVSAGLFGVFFGAGGSIPESFDALPPRAGHGLFAKILLTLIGLHVSGVIYHELFLKDRLLTRMGFGRPRRSSGASTEGDQSR